MEKDDLKLSLAICSLQRMLERELNKDGKAASLGWTDYCILKSAAEKPGISVQQIASAASLSSGSATYMLDKLENGGFLHRRRSETDSRASRVYLTDKGNTLEAELSLRLGMVSSSLFQGIIDEKKECALFVLSSVLKKEETG